VPRQRRPTLLDREPRYRTVEDLRAAHASMVEQCKNMLNHLERMMKEYENLEDEINEIDRSVTKLQEETGLTKDQIIDKDSLDEFEIHLDEE
jgi:conjugal transfer/entry exclusion protein